MLDSIGKNCYTTNSLLDQQTNKDLMMTHKPTADQLLVRKLNTSLILNTLRLNSPISRAELAKNTGLNRSTVSSIVAELIEGQLIQETELQKDRVGRPGMSLEINPDGGAVIGVEIGVNFIQVLLTDFVAQTLWQARVNMAHPIDQEEFLTQVEALIAQGAQFALERRVRVLGIGLGVPGLVNISSGELVYAPNLKWHNIPFRQRWHDRFRLPVFVENEANAAAMGEYYFGVAQQIPDFIFLSLGVGLGGGIMLEGKLFRGSGGFAGEIGHMQIDPAGELCACGRRGCWETKVSPTAVIEKYLSKSPASENLSGFDTDKFWNIVEEAEHGNQLALNILTELGRDLGTGASNLVNIFNPSLIVLGGALIAPGELLLPEMANTIQSAALKQPRNQVQLSLSDLGNQACALGAVALVLDYVMKQPFVL